MRCGLRRTSSDCRPQFGPRRFAIGFLFDQFESEPNQNRGQLWTSRSVPQPSAIHGGQCLIEIARLRSGSKGGRHLRSRPPFCRCAIGGTTARRLGQDFRGGVSSKPRWRLKDGWYCPPVLPTGGEVARGQRPSPVGALKSPPNPRSVPAVSQGDASDKRNADAAIAGGQ